MYLILYTVQVAEKKKKSLQLSMYNYYLNRLAMYN